MAPLTFRNSRIVYYGPHPCDNCGIDVAKMGHEWGGSAFTYPRGPVYPNTEWHPHVCDPFDVRNKVGMAASAQQTKAWPSASPIRVNGMWVIASGNLKNPDDQYIHVITPHCTFYDTELAAWAGAQDRQDRNLPTWWMDSNNGNSRGSAC